jgi:hypothetical protein
VSRGYYNVIADHKPVAQNVLEFWFLDETPRFLLFEGNRRLEWDESRQDRMAKILVGATLPAIPAPWHSPTKVVSAGFTMYEPLKRYAERLGIEHEISLLPKTWLHVMLSQREQRNLSGGGQIGSALSSFFDPGVLRLPLVQTVGATIFNAAGELLQSIYRIDVVTVDEVNRSLSVEVEAWQGGVYPVVTWTFDLRFPKVPGF